MDWFWAFLFTQIVEVPIYMRGLRARAYEAFGASALTHPIVWFVIPAFWNWFYLFALAPHLSLGLSGMTHYVIMVVIAETFAVIVEGFYFRMLDLEKPFRWSFIANMVSVILGFISRAIFGVP